MLKNYMKRSLMLLGAAAVVATASAAGEWSNITTKVMPNPAFIPGWCGAVYDVDATNKVAEVWNGAFHLYQVVNDAPAGDYTLTVQAFYRYSNEGDSQANMTNGANHNAFIFANDAKVAVKSRWEDGSDVPADLTAAAAAFHAGRYTNTLAFHHDGGDLQVGIYDLGGMADSWTAFTDFKLVGPNGNVELVNADFSKGFDKANPVWDFANLNGSKKYPDAWGWEHKSDFLGIVPGVYRKAGGSPYHYGVEMSLEAGKYRFGVQAFCRYGCGNGTGGHISFKEYPGVWVEEKTAYDAYKEEGGDPRQGGSPVYMFVTNGTDLGDDDVTHLKPTDLETAQYGNPDAWFVTKEIMNIFDEDLAEYPDNTIPAVNQTTPEGWGHANSGFENSVSKFFVNNLDKYRNYIEFEMKEAGTVWVGLAKDNNAPAGYWQPNRDFTIEKYVGTGGVEGVSVDADENAPKEYYNIQGMRVAEPAHGIFIVKQGSKVSKEVIK